jgi:hypothetical protein
VKRAGARDPVTPELREYVLYRDAACVIGLLAWRHELEAIAVGPCRSRDGRILGILISVVPALFDDLLTVAHVRDPKGGRMGKRPPSTARRLAAVCYGHHLLHPVVDRADVRPVVDAYLERMEGPELETDRPWERVVRVRGALSSSPSEQEGTDGPG